MDNRTVQVEENTTAHRFEARIGDYLAVAEYRRVGDTITFTHTEVPAPLEGRGIASSSRARRARTGASAASDRHPAMPLLRKLYSQAPRICPARPAH